MEGKKIVKDNLKKNHSDCLNISFSELRLRSQRWRPGICLRPSPLEWRTAWGRLTCPPPDCTGWLHKAEISHFTFSHKYYNCLFGYLAGCIMQRMFSIYFFTGWLKGLHFDFTEVKCALSVSQSQCCVEKYWRYSLKYIKVSLHSRQAISWVTLSVTTAL